MNFYARFLHTFPDLGKIPCKSYGTQITLVALREFRENWRSYCNTFFMGIVVITFTRVL